MVQITRHALCLEVGESDRARMAREFRDTHVIRLPRFFGADLLQLIERRLPHAGMATLTDEGREVEQAVRDPGLNALVHVLLNDPALFGFVDDVTGCGRVRNFTGRLSRLEAQAHHFGWHDDCAFDRRVGLSVNLGREPHRGGVLQFREAATGRPLGEAANTGYGDAMLFRIDAALEHRVTRLEGEVPRVTLAGWFCEGPDYWAAVRATQRAEA